MSLRIVEFGTGTVFALINVLFYVAIGFYGSSSVWCQLFAYRVPRTERLMFRWEIANLYEQSKALCTMNSPQVPMPELQLERWTVVPLEGNK